MDNYFLYISRLAQFPRYSQKPVHIATTNSAYGRTSVTQRVRSYWLLAAGRLSFVYKRMSDEVKGPVHNEHMRKRKKGLL